ncbi:aminodeoxychorismate synthase component I [Maricaulis sp. CAU 1757]
MIEIRFPWQDPLAVFAPLADQPRSLLLHGGRDGRAWLFAFPDEVFEGDDRSAFDALAASWRDRPGMLAGLFGYDLSGAFERLPEFPHRWPALAVARYPAWMEFDPGRQSVTVRGETGAVRRLADQLETVRQQADPVEPEAADWAPRWDRARYLEAARRAREYVHAGDVFQVNLSHAFDARLDERDTPFDLFRRLCADSPAPHAAYFCLDADRVVLTNSPERFVKLRGGRVEARPIKGTRPRARTAAEDAVLAEELAESAKDRAENLMIVDLMRNDLARVCRPGSVDVPTLCAVESYANVHHLVSVVRGEMAADRDMFHLLSSSFPPGSITGAPKVRAMEIIAELEGEPRGPYCGALGWLDAAGDLDLNVMIRTAALRRTDGRWDVTVRSGGGIVADSDPVAEYDETLTKASALKAAVLGERE